MAYTTINKSSEYFNTKLYTGNGSTQSITGVGFQPDMVWTKIRNGVYDHNIFDVIRGVTKDIRPNNSNTEGTQSGGLTSFDSDGYSLGSWVPVNESSSSYVSWNWKANGSGVSNTDGSITSTVSANTTSGFSVVNYTGTASNATVGHGLGAKPAMIIAKNLITNGEDWAIYHKSLGGYQYYLKFGTTVALTNTNRWNAEPDTSVFNVGAVAETNGSGANQIAYVFAEKKGFSKCGIYSGNASSSSPPFIYTGFKPSFIMVKIASTGGVDTGGWVMYDNQRYPNNLSNSPVLFANFSEAESDGYNLEMFSNGFRFNSTSVTVNGSGNTYIYYAVAEQPLVGTNGVPATAR
jgi:hypothetical protein